MRLDQLFEAGIRTAQLDTLARKAVAKALATETDAILKSVEPKLRPARPSTAADKWDRESDDRQDFYDRLSDYAHRRPEEFLKPFCSAIQATLQRVTQDYADSVFEAIPGMKDLLRRLHYQTVNNAIGRHIRVAIEPREGSEDRMVDRSRGYFQEEDTLIKVFVDQNDLSLALWGFINEKLMGEDPDDGLGNILRVIIPTFLHEYGHYEQSMRSLLSRMDRGVTKKIKDFTYITPKNSAGERKRKGQRGGFARLATDNPGEWERYLGSEHEIDSWATSAASKMVDEMQSEVRHDDNWRKKNPRDWNKDIRNLQRNLAQGYGGYDNDSATAYSNLANDAFKGWYDTVDSSVDDWDRQDKQDGYDPAKRVIIPRRQIDKVRKIFLKKVIDRLNDYMRSEQPGDDKGFSALIKGRSASDGIMAIARAVARRIVRANDYWANRPQKIEQGYAPEVEKAESFIYDHFFDRQDENGFKKLGQDPDADDERHRWRSNDPAFEKTTGIFRRAVLRHLELIDPDDYGAEAADRQAA